MSKTVTESNFLTRTLVPLALLVFCPISAIMLCHMIVDLGGSFVNLGTEIANKGFLNILYEQWIMRFFGSMTAWRIIGAFMILQLILMKVIPGKKFTGTITPMGNLPEYKDNGVASYLISIFLFFVCTLGLHLFSPSIAYDNLMDIISALNFLALSLCLLLYFKGRFLPSSTDNGATGNFIFDFYWGTELYPRMLGWDVKQFTNCRFGMTAWAVMVISFVFAQVRIYGSADWSIVISAALICIYLLKFFIWEPGYMRSMDIIVDRAGFYICWGCLVWVPAIYTSPVMFMVVHPAGMPLWLAVIVFVLGLGAILINYWADHQRQIVRKTNGDTTIWGQIPVLIHATYETETGESKTNPLLASGFWGISSHFHYVPEILAAFFWSCSTGFSYLMPFFYVLFLTGLLVHRSLRDDLKCQKKYGGHWDEYRELVPYKIIPRVF